MTFLGENNTKIESLLPENTKQWPERGFWPKFCQILMDSTNFDVLSPMLNLNPACALQLCHVQRFTTCGTAHQANSECVMITLVSTRMHAEIFCTFCMRRLSTLQAFHSTLDVMNILAQLIFTSQKLVIHFAQSFDAQHGTCTSCKPQNLNCTLRWCLQRCLPHPKRQSSKIIQHQSTAYTRPLTRFSTQPSQLELVCPPVLYIYIQVYLIFWYASMTPVSNPQPVTCIHRPSRKQSTAKTLKYSPMIIGNILFENNRNHIKLGEKNAEVTSWNHAKTLKSS